MLGLSHGTRDLLSSLWLRDRSSYGMWDLVPWPGIEPGSAES